jgi:branched-subunit amino acid ABC-type transport system permease component
MPVPADLLAQHFGWMQNPTVVARQALAGLSNGMLLFLIAAGLSLIFGVSRIINFAHGALFMLGAYLAATVVRGAAPGPWTFLLALATAAVGLFLLGALLEIALLRRIYRAEHAFQLLLTFGLVLVLGDVVKLVWGREDHSVAMPALLAGSAHLGMVTFPVYRLFLIAVGFTTALGLWLVLHRTRWGILVRAATMDRQMLNALGVNVRALYTGVFAVGAGLAGLAGALAAPIVAVGPGLHVQVIIDAFVVVVIGGMGSVGGALLGALLVGLANAFGLLAFPTLAVVVTFAVMAVVLIVRPWGLLGAPE